MKMMTALFGLIASLAVSANASTGFSTQAGEALDVDLDRLVPAEILAEELEQAEENLSGDSKYRAPWYTCYADNWHGASYYASGYYPNPVQLRAYQYCKWYWPRCRILGCEVW